MELDATPGRTALIAAAWASATAAYSLARAG
jgi:hypothetical protein